MARPFHTDGTPCHGDTCAWRGDGGHKTVLGTVCPQCGSDARLYDLDRVEAMTPIHMDPQDGKQVTDGDAEIIWDGSKTVGIYCRACDWNGTGPLIGAEDYTYLLVSPEAFERDREANEQKRVDEARREALAKMKEMGI